MTVSSGKQRWRNIVLELRGLRRGHSMNRGTDGNKILSMWFTAVAFKVQCLDLRCQHHLFTKFLGSIPDLSTKNSGDRVQDSVLYRAWVACKDGRTLGLQDSSVDKRCLLSRLMNLIPWVCLMKEEIFHKVVLWSPFSHSCAYNTHTHTHIHMQMYF